MLDIGIGRGIRSVEHEWDLRDEYRDADSLFNQHVHTPLAGITRHMIVRETDAEAVALARRAWPVFQRNWDATSLRMPGGRLARARIDEFDDVLAEGTNLLVRSPRTVRDFLATSLDRLNGRPSFDFAPAVQWGDLTNAESLESMQLFAYDVMPALVRTPVPAP